MINNSIMALKKLYKQVLGKEVISLPSEEVFTSAPGRINLIGEHTDYNSGHILPGAIDKKTYCAGRLSDDEFIYLYSGNFDELIKFNINDIKRESEDIKWYDYAKGVIKELINAGYNVKPFMLGIYGDVPIGVGVSSSASFEVAITKFIAESSKLDISESKLIELTRAAENNFVGVKCGIMDQLTSIMGREGFVIHVDCEDLSTDFIPFPKEDVSIILVDSLKTHSLSDSGYNKRLEECEQLLEHIKKNFPQVKEFRDISIDILEKVKSTVPANLYKRGKHFIDENNRVKESIKALKNGDIKTLGSLMFSSHESLKDNYEVSTTELDRLVELAGRNQDICYGARLMGAGFGGATINLVKAGKEEDFIHRVADRYYAELGRDVKPKVIICKISDGAKIEKP